MKLMLIPPGEFRMGSPPTESGRTPREIQHRVTISKPLMMPIHEVTQKQYQEIMGINPSTFKGDDVPVADMVWSDAMQFCNRLSERERALNRTYRLPTEAEWEFACRAGTETAYFSGESANTLNTVAWYKENAMGENQPVGWKKPNAWGLFDMHGNVWEWTLDGMRDFKANETVVDPRGPMEAGHSRAVRGGGAGGAFGSPPNECRSASRQVRPTNDPGTILGLRVILEIKP